MDETQMPLQKIQAQRDRALYDFAGVGNITGIEASLQSGANIDSVHDNGETALHAAARKGNEKALELLFRNDADTRAEDGKLRTPRDIAREYGNLKIFADAFRASGRRSWLQSVAKAAQPAERMLPVRREEIAAAPAARRETANLFPESRRKLKPLPGDTFNILAAAGRIDGLKWLYEANSSRPQYLNQRDKNGMSALDFAVQGKHSPAVRYLLSEGVDVNASGALKITPLMRAAAENENRIISMLQNHGADVNAQDREGNNALIYAVDFNAHAALPRLLKLPGIAIDQQNNKGHSALHVAAASGGGYQIAALVEAGADLTLIDKQGKTPARLAYEAGHSKEFTTALESVGSKRLHSVESTGRSR